MSDYLQRFTPAQQKELRETISVLRLSFSNQNKFLEYIYEILQINEILNFTKLIASLNIKEILADKNIQGKKKGEKVIEKLFEIRFPETTILIKEGKFSV